MKKILAIILCSFMVLSVFTLNVFAESDNVEVLESIEYFEDGSYIVTTITEEANTSITRTTYGKTGSKTATIYNSDDEAMVVLKVTGTFSYTGSSSTCTASSVSYTIYNDNWKVTSATASKSGNKAIGEFTSKRYTLLIPVQTVNSTVTLTCSNSGTLS